LFSTVFQCNQGVDLLFDGLGNKTVEIRGVLVARPNWKEQPPSEGLTGKE
jgi:hypothetical protein